MSMQCTLVVSAYQIRKIQNFFTLRVATSVIFFQRVNRPKGAAACDIIAKASLPYLMFKLSDNTYSNCHPMLGSVTECYYRWLGGIRPNPQNPGFKEFTLAPATPDGLDFVNCSYHSPYGEIVSNWQKGPDNSCRYEMRIPAGSVANVKLPVGVSQKLSIESTAINFRPDKIKGLESGNFKLNEGTYIITVLAVN